MLYGVEYRFDYYGGTPGHRIAHIYIRSDWGEASGPLVEAAWAGFFIGPITLGALAYISAVLFAPGRLRGNRWGYVFGIPVAVVAMFALWFVLLAPWFFFPQRAS